MPSLPFRRGTKWLLRAGYALVVAVFALALADREPHDDAHFFKRIALNLLDHGTPAWNVADGPVHGTTSQTFQGLAVLVALVTREHSMVLVRAISAAFLIGAFVVLHDLTARRDHGVSLVFGLCSSVALFPLVSGMETTLALLSVSGTLWLSYAERARSLGWAFAPLAVVFLYLTRPDAALLGLGPLLVERWRNRGVPPLRELALLSGALALVLLVLRVGYGTALPFSFYAKQVALSPYDPDFLALSSEMGQKRFFLFAACATPLLLRGLLRRDATNAALLGSALVFVGYHLAATIDVMGMHGRFYAPALPLLVLASARASEEADRARASRLPALAAASFLSLFAFLALSRRLPSTEEFPLERVPLYLHALTAAGGVALLLSFGRPHVERLVSLGVLLGATVGSLSAIRPHRVALYSDEDYLALQSSRSTVYRGLDTLRACFGERTDAYHSEVGLVGLRLPDGKVTDLAGLFSPELLFETASFDEVCARDRPLGIFLPHRNYEAKVREILASRCIAGYERVIEESSSPLYVRKDEVERFRTCAAARRDPFVVVE